MGGNRELLSRSDCSQAMKRGIERAEKGGCMEEGKAGCEMEHAQAPHGATNSNPGAKGQRQPRKRRTQEKAGDEQTANGMGAGGTG